MGKNKNLLGYSVFLGATHLACNLMILAQAGPGLAQPVPDATLGLEQTQVNRLGVVDLITGGATRGANLFHSFEQFSISAGEGAYFDNPVGITAILSRVTGANPSEIQGSLGVLGEANLFFLNPNGVIFGPDAILDIPGSFVVSTAEQFVFADDTEFSANAPTRNSLLTISTPVPLQPAPPDSGAILFDGSGLLAGKGFTLIANQVELLAGSYLYVAGDDGSNISINTQDLRLLEGSSLLAGIEITDISGTSATSNIQIQATGNVLLDEGRPVLLPGQIFSLPSGILMAGNQDSSININAQNLDLLRGPTIASYATNASNGSDIVLTIENSLRLDGSSQSLGGNLISPLLGTNSILLSSVLPGRTGAGGRIQIEASKLELADGGAIVTTTSGLGLGGDIEIDAQSSFSADGFSQGTGFGSGVYSLVLPGGQSKGGDINISSKTLKLTDGGYVNSYVNSSNILMFGNAGDININTSDFIEISRFAAASGLGSGVVSVVDEGSVGNSGQISLTTKNLNITDGGLVGSLMFGNGNAGDVSIRASSKVNLEGANSAVRTDPNLLIPSGGDVFSGVFSVVEPSGSGNSGAIKISTQDLNVANGSVISTGARGLFGNSGKITLQISDSAIFDGFSEVSKTPIPGDSVLVSGVFSSISPVTNGDGGDITISANKIKLINGARLTSSNFGVGNAGSITLNIAESALFDGNNPFEVSLPGGISTSVEQTGTGAGGDLKLTARDIQVQNEAVLLTRNLGIGQAGDIIIGGDTLSLDKGGQILANSVLGNGGNVFIGFRSDKVQQSSVAAPLEVILLRGDSLITTSAGSSQNPGNGGDITILSPFIVGFREGNSDIIANSFNGAGGNITVRSDAAINLTPRNEADVSKLRQNRTNDISASSQFGNSGTLNLNGLNVDLSRGLTELPGSLVDPSDRVTRRCSEQAQPGSSSLVLRGLGGLPSRPNTRFGSRYRLGQVQGLPSASAMSQQSVAGASATVEPAPRLQEAGGWQRLASGDIRLVGQSSVATASLAC